MHLTSDGCVNALCLFYYNNNVTTRNIWGPNAHISFGADLNDIRLQISRCIFFFCSLLLTSSVFISHLPIEKVSVELNTDWRKKTSVCTHCWQELLKSHSLVWHDQQSRSANITPDCCLHLFPFMGVLFEGRVGDEALPNVYTHNLNCPKPDLSHTCCAFHHARTCRAAI